MNAPTFFRVYSEMNVSQFKTELSTSISWCDLKDINDSSNAYDDTFFDKFSTAYNSCFP